MRTKTFIEIEDREELWTIIACLKERELSIQESIDFFNGGSKESQTEEDKEVTRKLNKGLHKNLKRIQDIIKRLEKANI